MTLENQVISLEQSKRLKELGIEQNSYFFWQHYPETIYRKEALRIIPKSNKEGITDRGECWSAFTASELGVMLPDNISHHRANKGGTWDGHLHRCLIPSHGKEVIGEQGVTVPLHYDFCKHGYDTEAECKAATLIYCLENKLTTPEECNSRLKS